MDVFKTLLVDSPTVLASDGTGLLQASNNLSDVDDVGTSRDNLDVYSKAEVNANNFIKQDSGFPISDGATTDRAERAQYGSVGDVAGLPVTFISEFVVPSSTVPTGAPIIGIQGVTNASFFGAANSTGMALLASEALTISTRGAVPGTDFRSFSRVDFRSDYAGQSVRLVASFAAGDSSTPPTVHCNGENITSQFAAVVTGGSAPNWMDASLDTTWSLYGHRWPAGRAPYSRLIVGALSDTEAAAYTAGMPLEQAAPWTRFAGSAAGSTGIWQNRSDGSNGFDSFSGASASGFTGTHNAAVSVAYIDVPQSLGPGHKIQFTADWTTTAANAAIWLLESDISATATGEQLGTFASGTNAISHTVTKSYTTPVIVVRFEAGAAVSDVTVSNSLVAIQGPLDRPIYQPALATDDAFGRFSRRLVGMTPVSSKSDFRIIGNTATSGNEQVLSGAVLEDADAVVDSVEFDTDGTPTITLGSASGGAQYVASTALSAGLNADETLVTRKAASTALWVGSNSTANVRTYVSGHKINGV